MKVYILMANHDCLPGADDSGRQSVAEGAEPDVDVGAEIVDTLLEVRSGNTSGQMNPEAALKWRA